MAEIFPFLAKKTDIQFQEMQKVPNNMNKKDPCQRHYNMSKTKDEERILKAARINQLVTYNKFYRQSIDFSIEILQARNKWYIQNGEQNKRTSNQ